MRTRWIYPRDGGEPFEVGADWRPAPEVSGPLIVGDLPGYQSPATGLWVEGRRARREDFKRSGTRPWEGLDAEKREAQRHIEYTQQRHEQILDRVAHETFYQLPPSKRAVLTGRR